MSIVSDLSASDLASLTFLEGHLRDLTTPEHEGPHPGMVAQWRWALGELEIARETCLGAQILWPTRVMMDLEAGRHVERDLREYALRVRAHAGGNGASQERPARDKLNAILEALGAVLRAAARFEALVWSPDVEAKPELADREAPRERAPIGLTQSEFDRFAFFLPVCVEGGNAPHTIWPRSPSDPPEEGSAARPHRRVPIRYPDFERVYWFRPRYSLQAHGGGWRLMVEWREAGSRRAVALAR